MDIGDSRLIEVQIRETDEWSMRRLSGAWHIITTTCDSIEPAFLI